MKATEIEVTIHLDDDTSVTITADGKRPAEAVNRVLTAFHQHVPISKGELDDIRRSLGEVTVLP